MSEIDDLIEELELKAEAPLSGVSAKEDQVMRDACMASPTASVEYPPHQTAGLLRMAATTLKSVRQQENEACAEIAEQQIRAHLPSNAGWIGTEVASAIRARNQKD